jgi:hypothetical protein
MGDGATPDGPATAPILDSTQGLNKKQATRAVFSYYLFFATDRRRL